jgi:CRP-like cAMP-binding protein
MTNFSREEFTPGQDIFCAGDQATHLYFLEQGEVELTDASGNVFGSIPQGQSFGEAAILFGGIRAASIRAKTNVVCKKINNEDASELFKSYSPLLVLILEALLLQLSMNNKIKKTLLQP